MSPNPADLQDGPADTIDVADFIDRQPVGGYQIGLLLMCATVLFVDEIGRASCRERV